MSEKPSLKVFCTSVRHYAVSDVDYFDRDKWNSLKKQNDRNRCATASILRRYVLEAMGANKITLHRYCAGCGSKEHGLVYARESDGTYWMVTTSHAHNVVLVGAVPIGYKGIIGIGVDVECIERIDERIKCLICTKKEISNLEKKGKFVISDIWVAKEAILKSTGYGLHISPKCIDLASRENGENWIHGKLQSTSLMPNGALVRLDNFAEDKKMIGACYVNGLENVNVSLENIIF